MAPEEKLLKLMQSYIDEENYNYTLFSELTNRLNSSELIAIINQKIESAFNHLKRLHSKTSHYNISDTNNFISDTLLIMKLIGEIDAYNDVLATIRGMKE